MWIYRINLYYFAMFFIKSKKIYIFANDIKRDSKIII